MISTQRFGEYKGKKVTLYVLKNDLLEVGITDFGTIIQYIKVQTGTGVKDITLGFPTVEEYVRYGMHTGGTIGRVANRIGGAKCVIDGKTYSLENNDNGNCLHSGTECYDTRFFEGKIEGDVLRFTLFSPAGDQGFPGNLQCAVEYQLTDDTLEMRYFAETDKDTYFAPTNHTYFNLNGENSGDIYGTILTIYADKITPINEKLTPDGTFMNVCGTPFDFTKERAIGMDLFAMDTQLKNGGGYDHNFVLYGDGRVATAVGEKTGIRLDVFSDMPGVQLYTGNMIGNVMGKSKYKNHYGFCLEPQFFPDAPNHPSFPQPVVRAGERVKHYIQFKITIK